MATEKPRIRRVARNGQVTLPKDVRNDLAVNPGDYITFRRQQISRNSWAYVLEKIEVPDQAHFHTNAWQDAERDADADNRAGKVHKLSSVDDLDK